MSKIIIRGGKRLHGCVDIAGAKNAVLPIMAASLLNSSVTVINNCPDIEDVRQMAGILKYLGCIVKRKDSSIIIDTKNVKLALEVDEVVEIGDIEPENIVPMPEIALNAQTQYMPRVANVDGNLIILLDVTELLSEEEEAAVKQMAEDMK